jgi:hypothetical protein
MKTVRDQRRAASLKELFRHRDLSVRSGAPKSADSEGDSGDRTLKNHAEGNGK